MDGGQRREPGMREVLSELRLICKCSAQHYQVPEVGVCTMTLSLFSVRAGPCFRFDLFLAQRHHYHMVSKLSVGRKQLLEDRSGKPRVLISNELPLGREGDGYLGDETLKRKHFLARASRGFR